MTLLLRRQLRLLTYLQCYSAVFGPHLMSQAMCQLTIYIYQNANIGPCSEVCVANTTFRETSSWRVSLFSNTRVRVCDRIPISIIKIDKTYALEEGSRPTPHLYEYNLDTERHPTLLRCNEDRIRVTSGTAEQINIHHITKWTKFNTTVV